MTETTARAHLGAPSPQPPPRPYTEPDGGDERSMGRAPVEPSAGTGVRSRESLARADRIQIALLAGLFALLAAMLGAGALAYTSLSGQLLQFQQSVHGEISGLRSEIQDLSGRVTRIETMIEIHHGPPSGL